MVVRARGVAAVDADVRGVERRVRQHRQRLAARDGRSELSAEELVDEWAAEAE